MVIYLGNDAYAKRRLHPLFKVKPNEQGITVVKIYETHKKSLDKKRAKSPTDYPEAAQSQTVSKTENLFIGYLTGDVWKEFSSVVSQRFSEERELFRLQIPIEISWGRCK